MGQFSRADVLPELINDPHLALSLPSCAYSQRLVAPGSLLSGAAMILIPLVNDTTAALAGLVLLWAAGNTLSMAAPKNFVSINAPPEKRVQALAFLSTTGASLIVDGSEWARGWSRDSRVGDAAAHSFADRMP